MARITRNELLSDIELRVNQGVISDDSELDRRQVAAWATDVLNAIVAAECNAAIKSGLPVPPIYITRETSKTLTSESVPEVDDNKQRMYFSISGKVVDLEEDGGVLSVTDSELNPILATSTYMLHTIRQMRYTAPSTDLPTYYRQGSTFFIEGLQPSDEDLNAFTVHYVGFQDVSAMADTDYLTVSDSGMQALKAALTDIAMKELYGSTPDVASDSVDRKEQLYHQAIKNGQ